MKFPHFRQLDQMDCGPTCLRMVAKYYGRHYSAQTLRERAQISREGVSMLGIAEAANTLGLRSLGLKLTTDKLINEVPLPCILHWGQNHFVVLYKISTELLGNEILSRIRGGKKSNIDQHLPSTNTLSQLETGIHDTNSTENFVSNVRSAHTGINTRRKVLFHIADPASGLTTYDQLAFEGNWLGTFSQGIALVLEPSPRFYKEVGENVNSFQISRLFKYVWQYKKLLGQLALGTIAGSCLSLLMPFLTQSVVDVGISTQDISFINLILIAQLSLLIGSAAIGFLRSWILLHISARLNLTILSEFLSKLMRLPISFFDVKKIGDILQRIGDHHRIESFLTGQTLSVLLSLVNLLVFGFVLAYFHLNLFIVTILASILYALWVVLFLKRRKQLDKNRFDISAQSQSQMVQLIQGMQEIRLSGTETVRRWEWEHTQARLFKWSVKSLSLSQVQQAGAVLINQGKNILVTFLAAKAVVDGQLTLGGMVAVQYILGQFNSPVEQLIGLIQSWQDAQISLERLNEIHMLEDEERATHGLHIPSSYDININNITYRYPGAGNDPALENITMNIPHGKTTAIVGMSGSGKTTLLKLLLRFYEPQEGRIMLSLSNKLENSHFQDSNSSRGTDLKSTSYRAWRKQCGTVMQDGFIFSDTIARNIAVSNEDIDEDRLIQAAQIANIHEFIESLPLSYYTLIGAEGNGLSQGQRQRILIARSVYKNPDLLIFDEATNALDSYNEAKIVANLRSFFQRKTVVIVAHRLSTVRDADQIIVMEKGQIVETGTHLTLVRKRGKYFELISNQLELANS